jgi:hypothetical protein
MKRLNWSCSMSPIPHSDGDFKASGYSLTRCQAARLAADDRLPFQDRLVAWNIAHTPRDLAAPDAWTISRIAEKAERVAS